METNNLYLRKFMLSDLSDFSELIRDKMSSEYARYDWPFPTDIDSLKNVLSYFSKSDEFFAVVLKSENRVIGFISLNSVDDKTKNLGFCIHTKYQKRGYATEAVSEIKRYAKKELKLYKLVSGTAKANISAVKFLTKAGFIITGESIGSFMKDQYGHPVEFMGYSFEYIL